MDRTALAKARLELIIEQLGYDGAFKNVAESVAFALAMARAWNETAKEINGQRRDLPEDDPEPRPRALR